MKKHLRQWLSWGLAALLLLSCTLACAEEKPAETSLPQWTVMLYLCGTDLESQSSMATHNLMEISQTWPNSEVNVVIQTGGTREWHTKESLGFDIASNKTQRYRYDMDGFTLEQELPLQNMAAPATLTDFMKWSAENHPAQKYLLLLWDHGGGSLYGLIKDEMFQGALMSLDDLAHALKASGLHMEAIVMDACMMATLETAQAVQPYANYLIASEETVPGDGSAYKAWLQYLYDTPQCSGERFGRVLCDTIQQKYAELGNAAASNFLTFSVIKLDRIDAVKKAFDAMFTEVSAMLNDPEQFHTFAYFTKNTEHYDYSFMKDLADMAVRARNTALPNDIAGAVLEAVDEAVVYCVKGDQRPYSHGLSFFYLPSSNMDALTKMSVLDHFARNSQNAPFLAFLDAVNVTWSAPEWVYEQTERLDDISYADYFVESQVSMGDDGHLQLEITNAKNAVSIVDACVLQYDKKSDSWFSLGRSSAVDGDFETGRFQDAFEGKWPALDGQTCHMRIIEETTTHTLYAISCQLEGHECELRMAYVYDVPLDHWLMQEPATDAAQPDQPADADAQAQEEAEPVDMYAGHYELYGLWDGNDTVLDMPGRNIVDISALFGETIELTHELFDISSGTEYGSMPRSKVTLSRTSAVEETPLPKGDYAYAFVITDVLGMEHMTELVPFTWNGKQAVFALPTEE